MKVYYTLFAITAIVTILFLVPAYPGWTPAERISDETTAYSPRIVAKGDTLHVVYWMQVYYHESYYLRSIDGGHTWSEPYLLADTSFTSSNVVPIIKVKENEVFVLWSNYFRERGRNITFRKSADFGQTWESPVYILPSNNYVLQKHAMCVSDSDIFVIFSHSDDSLRYEFTKSSDWGQTWSESEEIFSSLPSGDIDIACRGDTIHFVWIGEYNDDDEWDTYYIKSEDAGVTWSENMLLSTYDDRGGNFPTISINEAGEIAVTWMDYKYSSYMMTGDILARYGHDSGNSWTGEKQLTFAHKVWNQQVLWHGDSIHVVWQDERYHQEDIFYMVSPDNGTTWGDEQRVDADPARSEQPYIDVFGENRFIVWNDRRNDPGSGVYLSRWEPDVYIDDDDENIPEDLFLQVYPNPFNAHTMISFSLAEPSYTSVTIYNVLGQKLATPVSGNLPIGEHSIIWDGCNDASQPVSSGVYFYRIESGDFMDSKKMMLLR